MAHALKRVAPLPTLRSRALEVIMSISLRRMAVILVAGCFGLAATRPASAQPAEQFYKGKTITILVGTSRGGINDITARFAAKHLARFIPGNPSVLVQLTPGGGGL